MPVNETRMPPTMNMGALLHSHHMTLDAPTDLVAVHTWWAMAEVPITYSD